MRFSFFIFIICALASCKIEEIDDYMVIPNDQSGDVEEIKFLNDSIGYVTGGEDWYYGFVGITENGGLSWEFDSLTNKKMFALDVNADKAVISGIDGKYYSLKADNWEFSRTTEWGFVKDVKILDDGSVITLGGHAYRLGFINKIDLDNVATRIYSEDIEFSAIEILDNDIVLAAAFGVILRSSNGGLSWDYTNGTGDFFKDLLYIDQQNIFALGNNGLILKSSDLGETWTESRKLKDFQVSDRLTKMALIDARQIWAVGRKGLIVMSNDLGECWEEKKLNTELDLRSIGANANSIFIGGTDGFFIALDK